MEDPISHIKTIADTTKHYVSTTAELYKLKAIDKAADGIATFSARALTIPFAVVFFIIMNVALTMWLGEELGRMSYGFFIVGGAYGLIGLILYLFGNILIKTPARNAIIRFALNIEMPWKKSKTPKS